MVEIGLLLLMAVFTTMPFISAVYPKVNRARHRGFLCLRHALENAGIEFIEENGGRQGARLRYSQRPSRAK
jgi:hypothetical protein